MIRVAMVGPKRSRCGIADYVSEIVKDLPNDIEVHWVFIPALNSPENEWDQIAREANVADLVHIHYEYSLFNPVKPYRNCYARFMKRLVKPVIVTLHDRLPSLEPRLGRKKTYGLADLVRDMAYTPFFHSWEKTQYRFASHYIVHTEELAHHVEGITGKGPVTFLHMPVPGAKFKWHKSENKKIQLITPGFVKAHKGYEDLLPVLEGKETWSWIIAGDAQDQSDVLYLENLKSQIKERRLKDSIEITGYLSKEEMDKRLADATIAIFPSRRCTGSASIAWAIAAGIPVVARDNASVKNMKEAGAGIELLPAKEIDKWPMILNTLLRNQTRMLDLANKNRKYAEQYCYSRITEEIAEIYRSLSLKEMSLS